jgi:hypothetical protein
MEIQRFFGRGGLARFMGISEARIGQINPQPDALVDGRPVWLPETAARLKVARESRRAHRQAGKRAAEAPAA